MRLILHEASALGKGKFGYGGARTWVVSPGTLMGMATSDKKAEASRANGKKGGRPRNKWDYERRGVFYVEQSRSFVPQTHNSI
jgi:hypothetical protein